MKIENGLYVIQLFSSSPKDQITIQYNIKSIVLYHLNYNVLTFYCFRVFKKQKKKQKLQQTS